ncbi:MAG: nfo [Anaerosporomusa subterranea]|jgi:deoxyribonuclease-4|nr:nfo [Anaerosporomusa subterranea]
MPGWLSRRFLTAYEYQCSRGVHVGEKTARAIGQAAAASDVALSVHAPYYINLATEDAAIAEKTINHIIKSLTVASWLGAVRVVFHSGSPGTERIAALERAKRLFAQVLEEAARLGLDASVLSPETMGKKNQLGNLAEVIELCKLQEGMIPTVDFGHMHAVTCGGYTEKDEFAAVFETIGDKLNAKAAECLHIHFSRIEFTKAGERRHWTFADPYGPPHEPLLDFIAANRLTPTIICESAGTQAIDAKLMADYYRLALTKS